MFSKTLDAEFFRALRNRNLILVLCIVPAIAFLIGVILQASASAVLPGLARAMGQSTLTPAARWERSVLFALGAGGNAILQIFYVLAAAFIFGEEYRWQTWRLVLPRTSRSAIAAARIALLFGALAASVLGLLLAGLITGGLGALAAIASTTPGDLDLLSHVAAVSGVAAFLWLELAVLGLFTGVVTAMTRSLLAGSVITMLAVLVQSILSSQLPIHGPPLAGLALLPTYAADMGRFFFDVNSGSSWRVPLTAAMSLAGWGIVWASIIFLTLRRQQFANE